MCFTLTPCGVGSVAFTRTVLFKEVLVMPYLRVTESLIDCATVGASAAAMGTAFIPCKESEASEQQVQGQTVPRHTKRCVDNRTLCCRCVAMACDGVTASCEVNFF